jgi:alkylation response protein AidB-like acyl-CoA dehydrogenase
MTAQQAIQGWGADPSPGYGALSARFRPLLDEIRAGALERELQRRLPQREVRQLAAAGLAALRVPPSYGGAGASLPELFNLLIELGEADSNVAQSLRAHFGFVEIVLNSQRSAWRERWLQRLGAGQLVGPGRGETGAVRQGALETRLFQHNGQWFLDGRKFYSTGLLYADWADVGATGDDGLAYAVQVRRDAAGVEALDDWNGFGQRLTSSGSTIYRKVQVDAQDIRPDEEKFPYSQGFYQLVHLATLAGIGRAISSETAAAVRQRRRSFSHGNAPLVRHDPQILEIVGRLRSAAYSAGAIVLHNAQALERAWLACQSGDAAAIEATRAQADLEVAQAQSVVIELILQAANQLFDALGASSTLVPTGLDRFWRNVRTLATHNPRAYKERIVGDFAVNGTPAPPQWKIGVA